MDFDEIYAQKILEEEVFIASAKSEVSSGGGTFNLHIKNPSGSGEILFPESISVETQGEASMTIYDLFSSAPSGGNDVMIDNMFLDPDGGAADTGVADANSDVSFTAASDGEHSVHVTGGGQAVQQVGGTTQTGHMAIGNSREIVIEVVNDTASAYDASITVVYFE